MNIKTKNLVKSSLFLALGLIVPYVFHLTGMAGPIFLPMHIPVLLCGFILGSRYGFIVGIITPFLNSVFTGMPAIYPVALSMALELGTYGFMIGFLYKEKNFNIIIALIISILLGRFISGIANFILITSNGKSFVLKLFLISSFVKSLPGTIIQLILIPFIENVLKKTKGMKVLNG